MIHNYCLNNFIGREVKYKYIFYSQNLVKNNCYAKRKLIMSIVIKILVCTSLKNKKNYNNKCINNLVQN